MVDRPAPTEPAELAEAGAPAVRRGVSVERTWLDDRSWVDVVRGWVTHADDLYATVVERAPLVPSRIFRYDRWIEEPHLATSYRVDQEPPSPALRDATRALQARYRVSFASYGLVLYRDGRDAMAFHRDTDLRWLEDTVVALLVLGDRRPFHIRPRSHRHAHGSADRGATHDIAPGHGDLLVMGGACQAGWEHAVPPVRAPVGGRLSVQWRWTSRTGRPFAGASWGAPVTYDR